MIKRSDSKGTSFDRDFIYPIDSEKIVKYAKDSVIFSIVSTEIAKVLEQGNDKEEHEEEENDEKDFQSVISDDISYMDPQYLKDRTFFMTRYSFVALVAYALFNAYRAMT